MPDGGEGGGGPTNPDGGEDGGLTGPEPNNPGEVCWRRRTPRPPSIPDGRREGWGGSTGPGVLFSGQNSASKASRRAVS